MVQLYGVALMREMYVFLPTSGLLSRVSIVFLVSSVPENAIATVAMPTRTVTILYNPTILSNTTRRVLLDENLNLIEKLDVGVCQNTLETSFLQEKVQLKSLKMKWQMWLGRSRTKVAIYILDKKRDFQPHKPLTTN